MSGKTLENGIEISRFLIGKVICMMAYLELLDHPTSQILESLSRKIYLSQIYTKIGYGKGNDVVLPSAKQTEGYLTIYHEEDGYHLEASNIAIYLNGYPIAGKIFLQNRDCIKIENQYEYRFIELEENELEEIEEIEEIQEEESEPTNAESGIPTLGGRKCRIRLLSEESSPTNTNCENPDKLLEIESLENTSTHIATSNKFTKRLKMTKVNRGHKTTPITAITPAPQSPSMGSNSNEKLPGETHPRIVPALTKPSSAQDSERGIRRRPLQLQDISVNTQDPGMTLMMNISPGRASKISSFAELIAPSNGQILPLNKDRFVVGRMSTCDLCLVDDYISRQQLEFSKTSRGFLLKNIGKNDVIVEKRGIKGHTIDAHISSEEKSLKPGESTFLSQEATIIMGSQILYYFNVDIPNLKTHTIEISVLERKYKFYKYLAEQKRELLRAAQVQKILTPPRCIFNDLQVGVWFKYFAIGDLSGDFFLNYKRDEALFVCLGDVSGHGPASALWASQIAGMFDALASEKDDSEEIVAAINRHLYAKKNPKHTLYALLTLVKITNTTVEFCIAGNAVPPLYYSAREQKLSSLDTPSTPVGMMGPAIFKTYNYNTQFAKDDLILIFTDGVTEAEMLNDGSQIEYSRVQVQIEAQLTKDRDQEHFLETFLSWLDQNCEIQDDLSMVLIARL